MKPHITMTKRARALFKTQSNTFDGALLLVTISQNAPSQIFNWFLNMPLLTRIISTFGFEQVNDFWVTCLNMKKEKSNFAVYWNYNILFFNIHHNVISLNYQFAFLCASSYLYILHATSIHICHTATKVLCLYTPPALFRKVFFVKFTLSFFHDDTFLCITAFVTSCKVIL